MVFSRILLCNRMADSKLGVVVRGVRQIDPIRVAETIAWTLKRQLAVAVIGYGILLLKHKTVIPLTDDESRPSLEIASTIEAAVTWRNQASSYAGRILVFVPGEVDKLGSLHSLDALTIRDMTLHLIRLGLPECCTQRTAA